MEIYRNEYPRPDFKRENFISLNGEWNFDFDDKNEGNKNKWYLHHMYTKKINVPFCFESKLSGIEDKKFHDVVWYERSFSKPHLKRDERVILHFNSVDYECDIFINGEHVYNHIGGNTAFEIDITNHLKNINKLTVRVYDPGLVEDMPRGKQYWKENSEGIWYTRTTGIWKSVWMEVVSSLHLNKVYMTPNIDDGTIKVDFELSKPNSKINVIIKNNDEIVSNVTLNENRNNFSYTFDVFKQKILQGQFHNQDNLWTPENPHLYDIEFRVYDEKNNLKDYVTSYFGMRKIHQRNGVIFLNNRKLYQKLVLIQGYWRDGILTAPSIEDFKKDIVLAKEMGFNGGRIHQKVEDPYFYYLCDKLGFLIWCECASAQIYSNNCPRRMLNEWISIVKENYNHPSIITWTPLNESWGINNISVSKFEQAHANSLYYLVKSLDQTRFVISNDGWEQCITDLVTVHNYMHGQENDVELYQKYISDLKTRENFVNSLPANREILLDGYKDQLNKPMLLTEYGGVSFCVSDKGWGYTSVDDPVQYEKDLIRIHKAIAQSECLVGYCYTQLYDVEQETNGLLTYDREPKIALEKIKSINEIVK